MLAETVGLGGDLMCMMRVGKDVDLRNGTGHGQLGQIYGICYFKLKFSCFSCFSHLLKLPWIPI